VSDLVVAVRLLLLTGIPGTGKTTIGNYLADFRSFQHLDFEDPLRLMTLQLNEDAAFRQQVTALVATPKDTVVTWGFVPNSQLTNVLTMREMGFDWVWFDGNRSAARRVFTERATVPVSVLDYQMSEIAKHINLDELRPRIINTFNADGTFRAPEEIVSELLTN